MPMTRKKYRLQPRTDWVRGERYICHLVLNFMVRCSGCRQWLRHQGCVVTGTAADLQTFTILHPGLHLNDPIGPVLLAILGDIDDGVLVTNITSDSFTNRDNVSY